MPCGYGRVKSLTDASVRNCKGNISAFRPSIMVGVPAVWESIHKGNIAGVNSGSLSRKQFSMTLCMYIPVLEQLADSFVLSKASCYWRPTAYCIEWRAAISRDTQQILTTALGVKLIQECSHWHSVGTSCYRFCSTDMTGACHYTTSYGPTSSTYILVCSTLGVSWH